MTMQLKDYVKEFTWLTNYDKESVIEYGYDTFMDNVAKFFNCDSADDLFNKPVTMSYLLRFLFDLLNGDYNESAGAFIAEILRNASDEIVVCQNCGWLYPVEKMVIGKTGNWQDNLCEDCREYSKEED